ncbi:MAG: hypothetical protein OXF93_20065 [Acidobacteria bacterium]|nr:hypothetical protein [Acidobacteriota bacterium]
MIAHLNGRAEALSAFGWKGRDAEWLALVCLHSGVFLRRQYLDFLGRANPALAHRFVKRCGKAAVEEPFSGSKLRLCRIAARPLYRALGAEHVRHRREASAEVTLRRLLSLDYVLDHLDAPWLPTEAGKVAALAAAGVPEHVLPGRLYQGAGRATRRHFVHKLPLALGAGRATFVFVQAEDVTESGVRTWGGQHAALWAVLRGNGCAVEAVVAGRDPARLAEAARVLDGWTREPAPAPAAPAADADAENDAIRKAVAAGDLAALEAWGGLNGALARLRELAAGRTAAGKAAAGRTRPAIDAGRTWRSRRVPE